MSHATFQDHRTISSGEDDFTIYGHGGHLGHVTLTVRTNLFPLPKETSHQIWT